MTELTLFDLNSSKDIVKELNQKESKLILGGLPTEEPQINPSKEPNSTTNKNIIGNSDLGTCTSHDGEGNIRPCTKEEKEQMDEYREEYP